MVAVVNTLRYGGVMDNKMDRQSWLNAGLSALANAGPEGLRIMSIAQQLGVTKGSFYWHFKNLEAYQSALLDEWEQCYTQAAIDCVEGESDEASTKLRKWITGAAHADLKLDRAVRTWSLSNQSARSVRDRVDQGRIDYLATLLRHIGWSKDEALTLAQWTYWAWVGYATLEAPLATERQLNLILTILEPR